MSAHISGLFRYPIKGLSCEPLPSGTLQPGRGVQADRAFAHALPGNPFDEANPVALRKTEFLMLARQEALARLQTTYDPLTGQLSVRDGAAFNSHDLCTPEGRAGVNAFFAQFLPEAHKSKLPRTFPPPSPYFTHVTLPPPPL